MKDEPSTDEVLDDYSLDDASIEPDPGSELLLDGMPLEELAEEENLEPDNDELDHS